MTHSPNFNHYLDLMTRSDYGYGTLLVLALTIALLLHLTGAKTNSASRLFQTSLFLLVTLNTLSYSLIASILSLLPRCHITRLFKTIPDAHWLTGLAVLLRLPRLFDNLWYDEAFTAAIARLPLASLPPAILGDVHPPLWYTLEWLLARLSSHEAVLRLPALLFGSANVWLTYQLTQALGFSPKTARIASLLIAVLPAQIYYANEARGYTLLTTLVLVSLLALLQNKPAWFIVSTALLGWTHNIGFLYVAAAIAGALLYHPNRRWLAAASTAALGSALWLPCLLQQSADIANGFWIHPITLPGAFMPLTDMTLGTKLDEHIIILAITSVLVFTLLSLWRIRRWLATSRGALWAAFTFGVPAVLALAAALWQPVYLTRALLPSATLLVIAWAWLLANRPRTSRLLAYALSASICVSLVALFTTGYKLPVADYLSFCSGADSAYYSSIPARMLGRYYLPDLPQSTWTHANDLNQQLSPQAKSAFQFQPVTVDDLPGRTICYFQINTPLTSQAELDHKAAILDRYPHHSQSFTTNALTTFNVYLLIKAH